MPRDFWTPLDPETRIEMLPLPFTALILTDDDDSGIIAEYIINPNSDAASRYAMRYQRAPGAGRTTVAQLKTDARLGEMATQLMAGRDVTIVGLPPIQWSRRGEPWRGRTPAALILAVIAGALTLWLGGETGAWWFLPITAAVFAMIWFLAAERLPMRILAPGDLQLDRTNVVEYAQGRLAGERPELRSLEERRASITARVDQIKEEFGRLGTDVVYRIENSALFDSSDPITERFQTALITWDTNTDETISTLEELAGDVEVSFAVAQDHAETVGMNHLPETARDAARRATNAARLAERASTEGERTASLRQVARILDSLALYYLPTISPETLAIEAPKE